MRLLPLGVIAALLALPASAGAATSLGQTALGGAPCDAGAAFAQIAAGAPGYEVRTGGVITELRTEGVSGDGNKLHVLRPRGSDAYTVLGSAPVAANPGLVKAAVRIPVQPGDVLGMSTAATPDPHPNCTLPGSGGAGNIITYRTTGPAPDAGDVTLDNADAGRLNVAASLEPDADGDGFGDETQDRCPSDATRSSQDCSADLVVTLDPVERQLEREDVNVVVAAVRNNGTSPASNVRIRASFPSGLQLVAASPISGGCGGGTALDCTFPSIAPGTSALVLVVVRAVTVGSKQFEANVSSPTPDPNAANNTAEVTFEVEQRRAVTQPGAFCRVPRLLGLSRAAAKRALVAAGCRLGATLRQGPRVRMRVRRQHIPAGVRVATGTRVGITLRSSSLRRR